VFLNFVFLEHSYIFFITVVLIFIVAETPEPIEIQNIEKGLNRKAKPNVLKLRI